MSKYFLLSVISLFIFSQKINAQDTSSYVNIHQDPAIGSLLTKHIQINENYPWVDGYRVQLYSVSGANSRDKANRFKAEFLIKNPQAVVYIVYQAPYYKVRVGDFRTKINALSYLQEIKKKYPSGFVVQDQIRFTKEEESDNEEEGVDINN
ncbi:MAG: hypothetical protein DSY76_08740 [Bacteroidetes bacterium]|nr:MAG: hypothetical protein DSY76_08740 [Bacteroidota bacterium]